MDFSIRLFQKKIDKHWGKLYNKKSRENISQSNDQECDFS